MQQLNVFEWLGNTALAISIRDSPWLFPIIETAHIIGFIVLVGSAFLFDLRLLGVAKKISVKDVADYVLPWSRWSLLVVAPTGFLLFMSEAEALSHNWVFGLKLVLILTALINAGLFHQFTFRSADRWSHSQTPMAARAAALISITLWLSVISCGRFIAYL
ncbi:DUF6644 family protein [Chryseolinea sp. T2]|uniref:DUF6644 family protein n=1 Tax=Chryseolinea sp. T2 TaxID=3129255 RepID=UPI00307856FF